MERWHTARPPEPPATHDAQTADSSPAVLLQADPATATVIAHSDLNGAFV
jgi:hypothetical protein